MGIFVNIIEEFGVVPESEMPETAQSMNSQAYMDEYVRFVRGVAGRLHMMRGEIMSRRITFMHESLQILTEFLENRLGKLPVEFEHEGKKFTPQSFLGELNKQCDFNLHEKRSVTFIVGQGRFQFSIPPMRNLSDGKSLNGYNISTEEVMEAIYTSLDEKSPVFIVIDVVKKVADRQLLSIDGSVSDLPNQLDARVAYQWGEIQERHAVTITAYNDGEIGVKPDYKGRLLRIENSYSISPTKLVTDTWLRRYLIRAVVDHKFVKGEFKEKTLKLSSPYARI